MKPRHLASILAVILLAAPILYGQTSITIPGLTEATSLLATDVMLIIRDPGGAANPFKITGANLLKHYHSCEFGFGNPNSADPVIADGDDQPDSCGNVSGAAETITAVACKSDAGTPIIRPILTGGSATSIVSGDLTCNTTWQAGSMVSPNPTLNSFAANGATCSTPPCTVDANIQAAGGTARYIVVRFTILGQ